MLTCLEAILNMCILFGIQGLLKPFQCLTLCQVDYHQQWLLITSGLVLVSCLTVCGVNYIMGIKKL